MAARDRPDAGVHSPEAEWFRLTTRQRAERVARAASDAQLLPLPNTAPDDRPARLATSVVGDTECAVRGDSLARYVHVQHDLAPPAETARFPGTAASASALSELPRRPARLTHAHRCIHI